MQSLIDNKLCQFFSSRLTQHQFVENSEIFPVQDLVCTLQNCWLENNSRVTKYSHVISNDNYKVLCKKDKKIFGSTQFTFLAYSENSQIWCYMLTVFFTLLLLDTDHKMDSDKLGHAQTWEFWCDNIVHTVKWK